VIAGLSAPVLYGLYRLRARGRENLPAEGGFVLACNHVSSLDPWPLVNPEITWRSPEKMVVWDACLSFLCIFMQVERHREIVVRYQDLQGAWQEKRAGLDHDLSELLQHEIDHLDGILCIDRVTDIKSVCTKDEFEKRYKAASPYAAAGQS